MTSRRSFLLGLGTALAAPAIVRAESLMKLWVPPAPKLIVATDQALADADYTGHLYMTDGRVVGQWTQKSGLISFDYTNPDQTRPKNGVWSQSGSGLRFSKMTEILGVIGGVQPYPPPHEIVVRR
jgi:hypothetical protein